MIRSMMTFTAALLVLPMAAMAQADCHGSMKDMLDGTLKVASEAGNEDQRTEPSSTCTLAVRQGEASVS